MKLIKEEFENYAKAQCYESGKELYESLYGNIILYELCKKYIPVEEEMFMRICWEIGISEAADLIKFEPEAIAGYCEIWEKF